MSSPSKFGDLASHIEALAEKHGVKKSGLPVNRCQEVDLGNGRTGMLWNDENGNSFLTLESKKSQNTIVFEFQKALESAGMERYSNLGYKQLSIIPEVQGRAIKELALQTETQGFFLWGNVGTGKTTLAIQISFQAIADNRSVSLYRWQDLLSKARATMNTDTKDTLQALVDPIKKTDLFVLDELANKKRSNATDFETELFFDIVASRHGAERPMILTSNMSPKEIEQVYGSALVSRLLDRDFMEIIQFKGKDKRL